VNLTTVLRDRSAATAPAVTNIELFFDLFKYSLLGRTPWPPLPAIAALALLVPLALVGDRLLLGAVAPVVPLTLALAAIASRRPAPG
jgi:hypothetical protein